MKEHIQILVLSNELNNNELSDKDKALVTEIVYGTLRRKKTIRYYNS